MYLVKINSYIKTECIKCHNIMKLISNCRIYSRGLKLKRLRCESCKFEYLIPDPTVYTIVKASVNCPINGLPILIFKNNLRTICWTKKNCKECDIHCYYVKNKKNLSAIYTLQYFSIKYFLRMLKKIFEKFKSYSRKAEICT